MEDNFQSAEAIKDIRSMMDRSSRFISLSGLSGISAGVCALIGAWLAHPYVFGQKDYIIDEPVAIAQALGGDYSIILNTWLFWIAAGTFIAAFLSAFFFTWLKSKKDKTPIWGITAKRLMINVSIPLIVGGIFLFRMMHFGTFGLVAPGCLIFYGLALINASKYTLKEIRYLGYMQLVLGVINLFFVGCGLYFWAVGFGILHILYGFYMWQKYDRNNSDK
ncbi:MAG: hypothetical protein WKF88_00030 [Ferruginibacter sp.]